MTRAPTVAGDRLDGWRLAEESADTAFDVRMLRVVAHTAVYEDARLRDRLRERAGVDARWRFFLASRLVLEPAPPRSGALERLVADRATDAFGRRLAERGFETIERAGNRRLSVGDRTEARLARFVARCRVADLELDVEAWLAVWDGGEASNGSRAGGTSGESGDGVGGDGDSGEERSGYLAAGGGYPRRVVGGDGSREAVAAEFAPERFREELFELIRATG